MPVSVTYAVPDVIFFFFLGGYLSMGINFEFHQLFQPKSIYTLEGRRPSAFAHPAVGGRLECINWFCPEKSKGIGASRKVLPENSSYSSYISSRACLTSSKLNLHVSCRHDSFYSFILSSWQLPSWPNGENPCQLTALRQAASFHSNKYIYSVVPAMIYGELSEELKSCRRCISGLDVLCKFET
jgi:hypothetical protein